jgi:hypothetical protein
VKKSTTFDATISVKIPARGRSIDEIADNAWHDLGKVRTRLEKISGVTLQDFEEVFEHGAAEE